MEEREVGRLVDVDVGLGRVVDPRLEQAARTLGARPINVFFTVTLPLSASGLVVGILLAFARSLGEFGATITFVSSIPGETRTLPT